MAKERRPGEYAARLQNEYYAELAGAEEVDDSPVSDEEVEAAIADAVHSPSTIERLESSDIAIALMNDGSVVMLKNRTAALKSDSEMTGPTDEDLVVADRLEELGMARHAAGLRLMGNAIRIIERRARELTFVATVKGQKR